MIYRDGFEVNKNKRFVKCPRCGNEEYSEEAMFCKICGLQVYNECEGLSEYDDYGNLEVVKHKNVGNARFCEYCGKKTMLFIEKFLKSYDDVQSEQEQEDKNDPFPFDEELPFN